MLEIPEAAVLAKQINETITGKKIKTVIAAASPHKFAWFFGDPQEYPSMLTGRTINHAQSIGGMVEISIESTSLVFSDGVNLRFFDKTGSHTPKHQLLLEFEDSSVLSASVQMYGGLNCFVDGQFDNIYYLVAKEKPSPLSQEFDETYFNQLISAPEVQKLTAKAFLATEQRIPGLGNGVLQDLLWNAKIHPKRKVNTLADAEINAIFKAVKSVIAEMTRYGGRDTEKDLFGKDGGYQTVMSKNNTGLPCPSCSDMIKKESYLGGSIYYCSNCQKM